MKTSSENLLTDLVQRTQDNLNQAQVLKQEAEEALKWKAAPEVWSALECFDHMNQFSEVYLNNIDQSMLKSQRKAQENFKSTGLGNWFTGFVKPGQKSKKIKTFKKTNPNGKQLDVSVIDTYIYDQQRSLQLLETARGKNLSKVIVPTYLGNWFRVKLGDAFRIIVYHNQRHLQQAQRSFEAYVSQIRMEGV